jgi:hypothetical protein
VGGDGNRAARELNCGMRVFDEPRQSTAGADDMQAGPAIEALSGILGDDPRRFLGEGRNRAAGESPWVSICDVAARACLCLRFAIFTTPFIM